MIIESGMLWGVGRVLSRIYHLGEKSWGAEGDKPPRGVRPPPVIFEMNMHWGAIWCILRHNFEKCYSVFTNLVASWWFFRHSYLYTVVTSVYKEDKVRKDHTQVSVMQMIAESLLFGNITDMERIFLNFFFSFTDLVLTQMSKKHTSI